MMRKIIFIFLLTAAVLSGAYFYVVKSVTGLPVNNPAAFAAEKKVHSGKTVVCLGDSITHGSMSYNYVDELTRRLSSKGFVFVNAGINAELAYNALLRVDAVLACKPDFVTVLIGTNDVNASMSPEKQAHYKKIMKLPQQADKDWYRENLKKICQKIKTASPHTRIALIALPPVGEDLGDAAYQRASEYCLIIEQVAKEENVSYLPIHEKMEAYLKNNKHKQLYTFDQCDTLMSKAMAQHYLMKKSYDEISSANGFLLVTDFLHLNSVGAGMIADEIQSFLER